jgi:hypothetical protein
MFPVLVPAKPVTQTARYLLSVTSPLTLSTAQQIRRLERGKRWLIRLGFLSLFGFFALFSHVPLHSTAVATLAVLATIAPLTGAVIYSFLVIDGRIHRLHIQTLRR